MNPDHADGRLILLLLALEGRKAGIAPGVTDKVSSLPLGSARGWLL